ncbi:MAG: DAK2 domain-containing protein [Candidatus Eremiobacteraeota bacterium]|nr:DAK2 domain-containing protein [Candidatus Eremiobacteraeota bacterium]
MTRITAGGQTHPRMQLSALNGRAYSRFIVAGAYFLQKYSAELNDLNVFPVPDGDTGSNMYLTLRAAALEAGKVGWRALPEVAAAAASGSLIGARGNSGVILSQMLRGFAQSVRHHDEIDTIAMAEGMREAVACARAALERPVAGTIISVAEVATQTAQAVAPREPDFFRLMTAVLQATALALERTREELPALKEANVVDAGAAGFLYFLEGFLRVGPGQAVRGTAFPQRLVQAPFTAERDVGKNKYCTEFILEDAGCEPSIVRNALHGKGDSLIVGGARPTLRVHIHTDSPRAVTSVARRHGRVERLKVDDMEQQHHSVLLRDRSHSAVSVVAVTRGSGFERIMRDLGAEITINGEHSPSVRKLLAGVNKSAADRVFLMIDDPSLAPAAQTVAMLSEKTVEVIAGRDNIGVIAALLAMRSRKDPTAATLTEAVDSVKSACVVFTDRDSTFGGTVVKSGKPAATYRGKLFGGNGIAEVTRKVLTAMGPSCGGLITLYYGATQKEKDAQALSEEISQAFSGVAVEYYYGGQTNAEYLVSLDE